MYTPALLTLKCEITLSDGTKGTGGLHFVLEDIQAVSVTTRGAAIKIGDNDVRIMRV